MGANASRSRPENVHHKNKFAETSQSPQNPFKPHQERRQQQTSFVHGGAFVSQPSTGNPQSRPIFQPSQQTTPGGATYRTGQQNPRKTSRPNAQQPAQQAPKPKKQTVSEVVQSLKEVLNGYDGRKFTLEGVDALYRLKNGENIPYAALGFTSLSAFIESKCPFLMIFTGMDGITQILLRPPSYQEATNHAVPSAPVYPNLQEKNRVSDMVHDEISQTDFNRLKHISDTNARNGLTIQQFDDHYLAEFRTRIDFKGFSKAAFFRGLGDIVEMREERDGLKLYSNTRPQNALKTPAKTPTQQNTAKGNEQGTDKKTRRRRKNNKKSQGGDNINSTPKHQGRNKECQQQQQKPQKPNQRSASNSREHGTKKLELAPYYEKELRKIIQECKSPDGVTPKQFKEYFNDHSTLAPFKEFGCSNEEFFKALPHIFQVQQVDNAIRLKPAPLTSGFARNNVAQWQSTSALDGAQARAAPGKVSAFAGNLATSSACTMHMLIGGRCLWIVSIENYEYVPTGCVAKLANMAKDTVINELRKHSLEIRYIRRLEDPNIKAALVKNNVAHEDEEVMTIPLKSVPIILRVFLGKDVDDVFMANLEEVSREHVRNKRFGRPNRQ